MIDSHTSLSLRDETMELAKDNSTMSVPLNQIRTVIVNSLQCSITSALLNKFAEYDIKLIICGEKKSPTCELVGLGVNSLSSRRIIKQSAWTREQKEIIWKQIVKQKIQSQMDLLNQLSLPVPIQMETYYNNVEPGDLTNMEGQAARVYFNSLFGTAFTRRGSNSINPALNYGYSILLSEVNRVVVSHGYTTAIGINHHSVQNPFNLSCDLMEPFRPVVDRIVYANKHRLFDNDYKKEFYSICDIPHIYNNRLETLSQAIDDYTVSVTNIMTFNLSFIPEVKLAG